jgi:predicted TIM-barrel fold metal-dependent hydrolase
MIIDFHTHVFPDKLAPKAMTTLLSCLDDSFKTAHDGTVTGLLERMDEWDIDVSVIQPVVTKPSQVKTTNEWVRSICSDRIVGFGGIYPHTDTYKKDIDYVSELGLKGLKFHAEYQNFVLDDKQMLRIYDYSLSKGLILLHHGGYDPEFQPPFKTSPQQFVNVSRAMQGGIIIAAHLGGCAQWDDVEEYLAGSSIYLDTSLGFEYFSHEQFLRIVQKHGSDKIVFASDSPWSHAKAEIESLKALPLSGQDIDAILGGNAKRLLNI